MYFMLICNISSRGLLWIFLAIHLINETFQISPNGDSTPLRHLTSIFTASTLFTTSLSKNNSTTIKPNVTSSILVTNQTTPQPLTSLFTNASLVTASTLTVNANNIEAIVDNSQSYNDISLITKESYIQTYRIVQPQWWNPWKLQLHFNITRNISLVYLNNTSKKIYRNFDVLGESRTLIEQNYSQSVVELTSQLLAPNDRFWGFMARYVLPILTIVLFLFGFIIEPICNNSK